MNNLLNIIRYKFKNLSLIFYEMQQIRECDLERIDYLEKEIEKFVKKLTEDGEHIEQLCGRLMEKNWEIARLKENLVAFQNTIHKVNIYRHFI